MVEVAHVEAGLRSLDRSMPEEMNRTVTDHVSEYLFTPSEDADAQLLHEGIPAAKIHRVGNVMIDTLRKNAEKPMGRARRTAQALGLAPRGYAVLTLHRRAMWTSRRRSVGCWDGLETILPRCPVVFPVHPRTRKRLAEFGLETRLHRLDHLRLCAPLGYLDFLSLLIDSRFVMTDSGGIQEETTALGIPCLTLRENTERPITVSIGTNRVIGTRPDRIAAEVLRLFDGEAPRGAVPPLWDGQAARRTVEVLRRHAARKEVGR